MTATGSSRWRELRRAASWHRRLLAAGLAGVAVTVGLQAVEPPAPMTTSVLSAAHDLLPGARLAAADLATVAMPAALVPTGALTPGAEVVGRVVAGPVHAGELLTDVRLVGPSLVDGLADGLVATPVRVADADMAALLRPGDVVDVLATPVTGDVPATAEVVGEALGVIAVPVGSESNGLSDGALLVLATTPVTARALASAAVTSRLSITMGGHAPA